VNRTENHRFLVNWTKTNQLLGESNRYSTTTNDRDVNFTSDDHSGLSFQITNVTN